VAVPKEKFREAVFQLLYSLNMGGSSVEEAKEMIGKELKMANSAMREATTRVQKILEKEKEIDEIITKNATSYSLERIHTVERSILRLALFEMLFDEEVPEKVAIVEAIRLCRKFGTEEAADFINAVLDTVFQKIRSE
jgi:N utilization substance protein B